MTLGLKPHTYAGDFEWPEIELPARPYGVHNTNWGGHTVDVERMRESRLRRSKEAMERNGVDAVLAINEWNNTYLTGVVVPYWTTPNSGLRYALYPGTLDAPILYEQGEIGYHAKNTCPWLHKVKVGITGAGWIGRTMGPNYFRVQTEKMVRQIMEDLQDAGFNFRTDVLAIDTYDPAVIAAFEQAGVKVNPEGQRIMIEARKNKSLDEVECMRITCAISEAMFEELRANLRPGVRESELVGLMHKKCYDLGGRIYSGVFVASGPAAWPNPRDETDRVIQPGDIVYADTYNSRFMGYTTCYYRTFSCGKASQKAKDDYAKSLEWVYKAIDVIKPGITTKEIAEQWPPGPEIWNDIHIYYEDQTAGSNWGHGIGLTLYEPPIIWREASLNDPVVIEEGMTFAVETQHGTPGMHGVRIEEVVHVTKTGVEILTKWPVQEITEVPY